MSLLIVGSNPTCAIKELFGGQFFFQQRFSLLAFGRWVNHIHLPLLSVFGSFKSGKSTYF